MCRCAQVVGTQKGGGLSPRGLPEAACPPGLSRESARARHLDAALRAPLGLAPARRAQQGREGGAPLLPRRQPRHGPGPLPGAGGGGDTASGLPANSRSPRLKASPRFSAVPREARARTSHTPPAGRHQPRETSLDRLRSHKPARHGGTARARSWALAQAGRKRCCGLARPSRLWSAPLHNGRCRQVRGEVSATYLDYPRAAERASTRISLGLSRGTALHRGRCEQARVCAAPLRQGRAAAARACGAPRLLLQQQR